MNTKLCMIDTNFLFFRALGSLISYDACFAASH